MKLVPVEDVPEAANILYQLLRERQRENAISHEALPEYAEHLAFVEDHPFLQWLLIFNERTRAYVGAIEVTDRNEIGVAILRSFQRMRYGSRALKLFLDTHEPLPAVPAVRNRSWLANVAPGNKAGLAFFAKHGFVTIQHTMALK